MKKVIEILEGLVKDPSLDASQSELLGEVVSTLSGPAESLLAESLLSEILPLANTAGFWAGEHKRMSSAAYEQYRLMPATAVCGFVESGQSANVFARRHKILSVAALLLKAALGRLRDNPEAPQNRLEFDLSWKKTSQEALMAVRGYACHEAMGLLAHL